MLHCSDCSRPRARRRRHHAVGITRGGAPGATRFRARVPQPRDSVGRYRAATSWIVRPGPQHPGARPLLEHRPGGAVRPEMRAFSRSLRSCAGRPRRSTRSGSGSGRAGPSRRRGERSGRRRGSPPCTGELADHDARSHLRRRRGEDRDVPSGFAASCSLADSSDEADDGRHAYLVRLAVRELDGPRLEKNATSRVFGQ